MVHLISLSYITDIVYSSVQHCELMWKNFFLMLNGLEIPIPLSSPNSDSKEMHGIGEEN